MSPQLSCMAANGLDTTRTVTLQPPWKKLLMLSSKQYSILLHLFIYYTLYFKGHIRSNLFALEVVHQLLLYSVTATNLS